MALLRSGLHFAPFLSCFSGSLHILSTTEEGKIIRKGEKVDNNDNNMHNNNGTNRMNNA